VSVKPSGAHSYVDWGAAIGNSATRILIDLTFKALDHVGGALCADWDSGPLLVVADSSGNLFVVVQDQSGNLYGWLSTGIDLLDGTQRALVIQIDSGSPPTIAVTANGSPVTMNQHLFSANVTSFRNGQHFHLGDDTIEDQGAANGESSHLLLATNTGSGTTTRIDETLATTSDMGSGSNSGFVNASNPPDISGARTWIQVEAGPAGAGSYTIPHTGGTPTSWAQTGGSLPTGFSFANGVITWDGTTVETADVSATFQASNADGSSNVTIHFVVRELYGTGFFAHLPPGTRFTGARNVMVVGDKANDPITSVVPSIDGVALPTVSTRTLDSNLTGGYGFNIWVDPGGVLAGLADGWHTLTATIKHTSGRDLVISRSFITDAGGTIGTSRRRYVDSTGGDDAADGLTTSTPMKHVWVALRDIYVKTGDCGGAQVYLKNDNHRYDRNGLGGVVTASQGAIRFILWPGQAAYSARFTSCDNTDVMRFSGTAPTIEFDDVDVTCDASMLHSDGATAALWNNARFDGPGRTTGSLQGFSNDSWPGGLIFCGRKSAAGSEDSNFAIWRNNQRGALGLEGVNVKFYNLGNQAFGGAWRGVYNALVDTIDATGTDDGTGNPFHNDGVQITFNSGRYGGHFERITFTKCRVSLAFHRSGVDEFNPTSDLVFSDIRYDDDTFEGGKYFWISRPFMGLKIANISAPRTDLLLSHNSQDYLNDLVRGSHVQIVGTFFASHNLESVGFSGSNDACDHIVIDRNATTGAADSRGTHAISSTIAACCNLATTYDYTVKAAGPLDSAQTRDSGVQTDVFGKPRRATTSVGCYSSVAELVPDVQWLPNPLALSLHDTPSVPPTLVAGDTPTSYTEVGGAANVLSDFNLKLNADGTIVAINGTGASPASSGSVKLRGANANGNGATFTWPISVGATSAARAFGGLSLLGVGS
jgi:hypothetical protein